MLRRLPLLALALPLHALAMDKGVAVVTSPGATGIQTGTEVRRDMLGECIAKLPVESQLVPVTSAKDEYLHRIDGTDKDGYVQTWSSTIQLGWQVRQRILYVVSTNGVGQTAPPQFREESALEFRTELVSSDPGESQRFASNAARVRFFATAQEAEASARKRATARIRELQANLCPAN